MQTIKEKYICLKRNEKHEPIGYQILINREKLRFTRFFSKKRYGTMEASLVAATGVRQAILDAIDVNRRSAKSVFREYRLGYENRVTNAQAGKGEPSPVKEEEHPVAETPKQIEIEAKDVDEFVYKEKLTGDCVAIVDENGISFENGENVKIPACTLNRIIELQRAFWLGYVKGNNNSKN